MMIDVGRHKSTPDGLLQRQVFITDAPASLTLHIIEFTPEQLTTESFAQAGIDCPESIQRSVTKRRAEFLFGRLAARDALATLGLSHAQIGIGAKRQPLWPEGVIGSITHTHHLAAAVAEKPGTHRGIGIDAEQVMREESCRAVAETVVNAQELAYLKSSPELSWPELLTIVFSAKESFYKAAYENVGRFFDFSAVRVTGLDLPARRLTLVLADTLSETFRAGQVCHAGFDFIRNDVLLTHVVW
jgi:enterobactin synthetase component D